MVSSSDAKFSNRPQTRLGWWAAWLGGAFIILFIVDAVGLIPSILGMSPAARETITQSFGLVLVLVGLAAGVISALALTRKKDRSWMVWVALLPGFFILVLILGSLIFPE